MRVYQFETFYPAYLADFAQRFPEASDCSYRRRLDLLLADRFDAVHILEPVYQGSPEAAFTVANDAILQSQWARERSLKTDDLTEILLAQIEEHRAEVIYCLDGVRFNSQFLRRLPGCVQKKICWHATPGGDDLQGYDLRVCNFPPFMREWEAKGMKTAWFSPSHDPVMSDYARNDDRPIDISFAGTYSAAHVARNLLLKRIAEAFAHCRVEFRLVYQKWKRMPLKGVLGKLPLPTYSLPKTLRRVTNGPTFGRDLYELFGRSKIVINAHGEIARGYRGNMRCFEAIGCGACMVSDAGEYSRGLRPGIHFETFKDEAEAIFKIELILRHWEDRREMGREGSEHLRTELSKSWQWSLFQELAAVP